jgi:hypothetical protein
MASPRLNLSCRRLSRYGRLGCSFVAGALLLSFTGLIRGQTTSADEYEIRGAMLINLTKFVDWPSWKMDSAHPQLVVCILGSDSIGPIAERYAQNQSVAGKPLQVRHISSVGEAASCNLLYVGVGEQKHINPVVDDLAKKGVLTVSESSNETVPNQVIGLPTLNDRVRIDINLGAAQRTGLTISSKLLRLATVSR